MYNTVCVQVLIVNTWDVLIIRKLWILKESEKQEIYLGCHIQGVTHDISQNHSTSAARQKRNLLL